MYHSEGKSDWDVQAQKLGQCYVDAMLCIKAAAVNSEADRVLIERDSRWSQVELDLARNHKVDW